MGVLAGFIAGVMALMLPPLFWPQDKQPIGSTVKFLEQYREKRGIYITLVTMPFFWILVYVLVVIPVLSRVEVDLEYLIAYSACGGLALGYGIIEALTGVSVRGVNRGSDALYMVDETMKRFGLVRIGIAIALGAFPTILSILI